MRNPGHQPKHERVDLILEGCPVVHRNRDPSKYDWNLGSKCKGIPIERWQPIRP